jgi:hypothetical protein
MSWEGSIVGGAELGQDATLELDDGGAGCLSFPVGCWLRAVEHQNGAVVGLQKHRSGNRGLGDDAKIGYFDGIPVRSPSRPVFRPAAERRRTLATQTLVPTVAVPRRAGAVTSLEALFTSGGTKQVW